DPTRGDVAEVVGRNLDVAGGVRGQRGELILAQAGAVLGILPGANDVGVRHVGFLRWASGLRGCNALLTGQTETGRQSGHGCGKKWRRDGKRYSRNAAHAG